MLSKILDLIVGKRKTQSDRALSEDELLHQRLDNIADRARREQERWGGYYADGRDFVFGNQLAGVKTEEDLPRTQDNIIFPAVTQEQALLAQRRAKIVALPEEPSDEEGATIRQQYLQWLFERELKIPQLALLWTIDAKTHGHWVVRTWWEERAEWDAQAMDWRGGVRCELLRPERVTFDPTGGEKWVHAWIGMPLSEAVARWPQYREFLEAAAVNGPPPGSETNELQGGAPPGLVYDTAGLPRDMALQLATEARLSNLLAPNQSDESDMPGDEFRTVWLEDIHFADETTERAERIVAERSEQDLIDEGIIEFEEPSEPLGVGRYRRVEDGAVLANEMMEELRVIKEAVIRPVYPRGRHVLRLAAPGAKIALIDEPWPLRRRPYRRGVNLPLPHTWHGLNGVEMVRTLQTWVNLGATHMLAYLILHSLPRVIVEEGAVANATDEREVAQKLRAAPGSVWVAATGRAGGIVERPAPTASGNLMEYVQHFLREARDQTGVQEIALGRQRPGETTATEALRLETNSKLRTALQSILQEAFIVDLMETVDELVSAHAEAGQIIRVVGERGELGRTAVTQEALDARYDLRLRVTSELPYDEQMEQGKWAQLLQMLGPLPSIVTRLLEAYKVPDAGAVVQELMGVQQAQQQAAASQQEADDQVRSLAAIQQLSQIAEQERPYGQEGPGRAKRSEAAA